MKEMYKYMLEFGFKKEEIDKMVLPKVFGKK